MSNSPIITPTKGDKGDTGDQGPIGPEGPQGPQGEPGEVPEAPIDGQQYARQDAAWSVVTSGGQWEDSGDDIYNTNVGNVGIGTDTPSQPLTVQGTEAYIGMDTGESSGLSRLLINRLPAQTSEMSVDFVYEGTGVGRIRYDVSQNMQFNTSSAERMRLSSAGNLGIGDTNPTRRLSVLSDADFLSAQIGSTTANSGLVFYDSGSSNTFGLRIGSSGDDFRIDTGGLERARMTGAGIFKGLWNDFGTANNQSQFQVLTQTEYDGITPDANTIYFIKE